MKFLNSFNLIIYSSLKVICENILIFDYDSEQFIDIKFIRFGFPLGNHRYIINNILMLFIILKIIQCCL